MYRQDRDRTSQLGASPERLPDSEITRRDVSPEEFRARLAADACVMQAGEMVNPLLLTPEELGSCTYKNESGFFFYANEGEPEQEAPMKKHKREKHPAPEHHEESAVTTAPTVEVVADAVSAVSPSDALALISVPDAGIPVPGLSAHVGVADLKSALPAAADTSGMTVLMAGVAVLGGGAAWKFYDSHSKRRHEQEMAKIERGDDSHKKCDASRGALESRVTELFAKIDTQNVRLDEIHRAIAEQKQSSLKLGSFDPEELEERLNKLEKLNKKGRKS